MKQHLITTGRSVRASVSVALLGVLVTATAGAYTVYAARHRGGPAFSLSAAPLSVVVVHGAATRYQLKIHRRHLVGRIVLSIHGVPAGARAHLAVRGSKATLTVLTSPTMPPGRYWIRVRGASGRRSTRISVALTVRSSAAPPAPGSFKISGEAAASLAPGVSEALNLALTNPNQGNLSVTSLSVGLQGVTAPNASPARTCTLADFSLQQFSGPYPLTVPSSSTRTLSDLGIPRAQWPQLMMLDRPLDQDGCQAASLALVVRGVGSVP